MKKINNWFTLIELLVVMAIVWIISLWASNINFNYQLNKQNSIRFTNSILTNIEWVRNDALFGRWVLNSWTPPSIVHPENWTINIVKSTWIGDIWNINAKYYTTDPDNPDNLIENNLWSFEVDFISKNNAKIENIYCDIASWTNIKDSLNAINIKFIWDKITLIDDDWNCENKSILEIEAKYAGYSNVIKLNTITGTIETYPILEETP